MQYKGPAGVVLAVGCVGYKESGHVCVWMYNTSMISCNHILLYTLVLLAVEQLYIIACPNPQVLQFTLTYGEKYCARYIRGINKLIQSCRKKVLLLMMV